MCANVNAADTTASEQSAYDSSSIHRWAARDLCGNGKSADESCVLKVAPIARPEVCGPTLSVFLSLSNAGDTFEVATLYDDFSICWDCLDQNLGYTDDDFYADFGLRMADLPKLVKQTIFS